jgi:hypothetical protein
MTPEITISQTGLSKQMDPGAPAAPKTQQLLVESEPARYSVLITVGIAIGLAVLASLATHYVSQDRSSPWVIWLVVAVGGLGGLAHEFAQSGGKILFFQRKLDGFYLGSLAGVILGAVAGLLAARGTITNLSVASAANQTGPIPLIFEAFLAGLALKGVAEAAGGQAVSPPVPPSTPGNTSPTNSVNGAGTSPIAQPAITGK